MQAAYRAALQSELMQHQIHFAGGGLTGDFARMESYLGFTARQNELLQQEQADRIGVSREWFDNRTRDEWWVYGADAVRQNCADHIVHRISCDPALTAQNRISSLGNIIRSACPLLWPSGVEGGGEGAEGADDDDT